MANLNQTKWADHLRGCAGLANELAMNLDIRDDGARQAMFATIVIDAGKHNVFCEPIPEELVKAQNSAPTVTPASPSPAQSASGAGKKERDDLPPANRGALQNPTAAQSEGANRGALLSGINSARELLKWTPVAMNEYIKAKLKVDKDLGSLDMDELAELTEKLSKRIDAEKKKSAKEIAHAEPEPPRAETHGDDGLDGWPD